MTSVQLLVLPVVIFCCFCSVWYLQFLSIGILTCFICNLIFSFFVLPPVVSRKFQSQRSCAETFVEAQCTEERWTKLQNHISKCDFLSRHIYIYSIPNHKNLIHPSPVSRTKSSLRLWEKRTETQEQEHNPSSMGIITIIIGNVSAAECQILTFNQLSIILSQLND